MSQVKQETFLKPKKKNQGPITCLGKLFDNDEKRREYFTELLREKLKDPEFRKIEGFPIGKDEDILALSDPPYYTVCPNPWFNKLFMHESNLVKSTKDYHRVPYTFDVSEGKNDPIYNAHTYHTKVPHKAIMRYILHYTKPGDVVFDGFCGTGMTGVAAQMCDDINTIKTLGYGVLDDGSIIDNHGKTISEIGIRKAFLNDLSPVATFISHNYNTQVDIDIFQDEATGIIEAVEKECGWMYETTHNSNPVGVINYVVWSDVFICPDCSEEIIFWEVAVDKENNTVKKEFLCKNCNVLLTKRKMERVWITRFDNELNSLIKQTKQVPVLINYSFGKDRFEKSPDSNDLSLIKKIENVEIPYWFPNERMIEGAETRRNDKLGLTHVHHFYSKRNLWILSSIRDKCSSNQLMLMFNSQLINLSKLNRYRPGVSFPYNPLSGTYYVGSQISEANVFIAYRNKIKKLVKAFKLIKKPAVISTKSHSAKFDIQADYIFTDPPFGANLNYSELSSLWEAWLKVRTNNKTEAIINKKQGKSIDEYRQLMIDCFCESYDILKPGRWITIEFSNTKSSVWNSIQTSLQEAGFIVSNVATLDKQLGSFKAVTTATAVKQDLVISAYKPSEKFIMKFKIDAGSVTGVWDFIESHLKQLPISDIQNGLIDVVIERLDFLLFDRMVAFHVQRGISVPINASEFYAGLRERYPERDEMFFLPEQVAEYDKTRMEVAEVGQLALFVTDEKSAIQWLRKRLENDRATYQDLHPEFLQELHQIKHEKMPELMTILEQNFLKDNKDCWYVPDVARAEDLEKIREKHLMREFWTYLPKDYKPQPEVMQFSLLGNGERPTAGLSGKKIKIVRTEAVRVGFKTCWTERDYKTIIVTAERLPNNIIQEDPDLLMYYDNALMREGE